MRVCFVSECPSAQRSSGAPHQPLPTMLPALMPLTQDGHTISWLTALPRQNGDSPLAGLHPDPTVVPPTCRYVLPCQGYTLAGLQVVDIAPALWQDTALHTRIFTFLRLFQEAVPCDVWHVQGSLPIVYLVVYTGRLLQVPVVVTYQAALLADSAQHPFLRDWLSQQVRHLVTPEPAPPGLASPTQRFPGASLHPMALPASATASQALAALYADVASMLSS